MLRKIIESKIAPAFLSAILLVAAFPGFNLWASAWIAITFLFFAVEGLSGKRAFLVSYFFGILFVVGTVYWIIHVTLPGMIAVVLFFALYYATFGLAINLALKRLASSYMLLFFVPSVWVALEFIRSHLFGGFGWVLLGHSQTPVLQIIQIADITGVYGVSFLVVLVNTAVYLIIKKYRKPDYPYTCVMLVIAIVFGVLYYGNYRMKNIFTGDELKVAVVQGNIPQTHKWDQSFRDEIMRTYADLTNEAGKEKVDLIIWPETSVPGFLEQEKDLFDAVTSLAVATKTPLLVGSPREVEEKSDAYFNSAFLCMPDGTIGGKYDKLHLVPFGEYIPFKRFFSFVEKFTKSTIGDFSSGKAFSMFSFFIERSGKGAEANWKSLKKVKFACLICFEDIFPDMSRKFVNQGARFLVNITNDAWFGRTSAPYQHMQNSIFRAVENRVNVVRAANTGVSCFIDQKGRVISAISKDGKELFVDGFAVGTITLTRTKTMYGYYGDIFAYLCILFTCISLFGYGIIQIRKPQ